MDVIEAYFASLRDLSFEIKITIKNKSQISNECLDRGLQNNNMWYKYKYLY